MQKVSWIVIGMLFAACGGSSNADNPSGISGSGGDAAGITGSTGGDAGNNVQSRKFSLEASVSSMSDKDSVTFTLVYEDEKGLDGPVELRDGNNDALLGTFTPSAPFLTFSWAQLHGVSPITLAGAAAAREFEARDTIHGTAKTNVELSCGSGGHTCSGVCSSLSTRAACGNCEKPCGDNQQCNSSSVCENVAVCSDSRFALTAKPPIEGKPFEVTFTETLANAQGGGNVWLVFRTGSSFASTQFLDLTSNNGGDPRSWRFDVSGHKAGGATVSFQANNGSSIIGTCTLDILDSSQ